MYRFTLADHKTGHKLLGSIAATIEEVTGNPIKHLIYFRFADILDEQDLWVAIIRHPYEIITSGYHYHKDCHETWFLKKGTNLYDGTIHGAFRMYPDANLCENGIYQNILRTLPVSDGLEYEMQNAGRLTINALYNWPYYNRPNVLIVRFEDFWDNFDGTLEKIIRFFRFNDESIPKILHACSQYNLKKQTKDFIAENKHVTNKEQEKFVYKRLWRPHHYNVFRALFPKDTLEKLGYEK